MDKYYVMKVLEDRLINVFYAEDEAEARKTFRERYGYDFTHYILTKVIQENPK